MNTPTTGAAEFETPDGLTLEARWDATEAPQLVVVFCHPHPQQEGTMNAPLMSAVAGRLSDLGAAVLRFNFRGVGHSEGAWGSGIDEIDDVAGAWTYAASHLPDVPHVIAGWSFGAATSLRWQAQTGSTAPWAGIAPPVRLSSGGSLPEPSALAAAPRLFVLGDRDQFTPVEDLSEYAGAVGGRLEILKGSDHFFYFREQRVADTVAAHFGLAS